VNAIGKTKAAPIGKTCRRVGPAHPVEHLLDECTGPGASRWAAAQPNNVEQLVVELDPPQPVARLSMKRKKHSGSRRGRYMWRHRLVDGGVTAGYSSRSTHLAHVGPRFSGKTYTRAPRPESSAAHDCAEQAGIWGSHTDAPSPIHLILAATVRLPVAAECKRSRRSLHCPRCGAAAPFLPARPWRPGLGEECKR
jgi:hypothetical protein